MYTKLQYTLKEIKNYIIQNTNYTNTIVLKSIITPFDPAPAVLIIAYTVLALALYPIIEYIYFYWLGSLVLYSGTIEVYAWVPTWWGWRKIYFWAEPRVVLGDLFYSYDEMLIQMVSGMLYGGLSCTELSSFASGISLATEMYWFILERTINDICLSDIVYTIYSLEYELFKMIFYGLKSFAWEYNYNDLASALERLREFIIKGLRYVISHLKNDLNRIISVMIEYSETYYSLKYYIPRIIPFLALPLAVGPTGILKAMLLDVGIDSEHNGIVLPPP